MRLAIVGASARAAAWSARSAGYEVVAADLFADADLVDRCPATRIEDWPGEFASWLANQQVDAWLYTGGLENYPQLVAEMARIRPLLGNGPKVLEPCRSPVVLHDWLQKSLVATPAIASVQPNSTEEWLVKSTTSAGGIGVADASGDALPSGTIYWQRRIAGRAISAAFVAADTQVELLGVTEQLIGRHWTGAAPYQYAGSIGPLQLSAAALSAVIDAGRVVATKAGLVGLFGIDFVLDSHNVAWVIEVNPRYTASMEVIERLTGLNMMAVHVASCITEQLPPGPTVMPGRFGGKAYLFAPREVTVGNLPRVGVADVPATGSTIAQGDPLCTLLVDAPEYSLVEPALCRRAAALLRQFDNDSSPTIEP
ncbi:ATP-grasp domain-containing protein [Aeoliella mucimassa]|uniref:Carbamoyl-phosphate synthase large chain n=1 Tax=Aeoliella mucimassa TaxID=2527972 RepID=A0A518AV11_9BACT|nr:ATP-grasp domain-containing protein [Aeoliella mucimassa]QDU58556.1 Carbamoyl-phosphate synthase large chain [Aeoliella mucimassa]